MKILIVSGTGKGKTKLAAFDAALQDAGIANFNLIYLSSIIPAGSKIVCGKYNSNGYGNKLYVVMSKCFQVVKNKYAWAGLGWVQDKFGRGVLVEAGGESKRKVKDEIKLTFESMKAYRKIGKIRMKIVGVKCEGEPVCALVAAVFKEEGW